jgi:hypothetical protein
MDASRAEQHRERARRAQQLSDRAHEQAGSERAAAERCERLMADATDPGLRELHRQTADLHRQALRQYEEAARLQQLHADHERSAAQRAVALESAEGDDVATADRRDIVADERDHLADVREAAADERDRRAGEHEQLQDKREQRQDVREHRFDEATGHRTPRERDQLARAKTSLRRLGDKLGRDDAALDRDGTRVTRDQAAVDRESAATARSEPPPADGRSDKPGEEST